MTLILNREEVRGLLDTARAMELLVPVFLEEIDGTTAHVAPPAEGNSPRVVGGVLRGMHRMGIRLRGVATVSDPETGKLLAVLSYQWGVLRVVATLALAARYLAPPRSRTVAMLGSGNHALPILEALRLVQPIERVEVFSPTPEHRVAFAERATRALDLSVTARDSVEAATAEADIVVVATSSRTPALFAAHVHPGQHVTSMGGSTELDASVYLSATQFVTTSRSQELAVARLGNRRGPAPLAGLVAEGKLKPESIVELGSILRGDVAPSNGLDQITVFRDPQGGVGDLALANYVYEYAREHGLGIEVDI
ncbi:MAG TPA: hypothetical protein VGK54_08775 [Chloroflexota bacterium]|jgi:ornithine cyclodeaminase/alanine dehydrogenase-like protein (mu-crystallin family)